MTRRVRMFLFVGFFLCFGWVVGTDAKSLPTAVEQMLQHRIDVGYNQSFVIGVVDAQGEQFYSFGQISASNGKSPDKDTVFEIGSVTKTLTGVLLADMVQRGEVSLDDAVEKYLPAGVSMPTRNGVSITLLDLSTHRSSLPSLPDNMTMANVNNPYEDYSVEQMYKFLGSHELSRDIGSEYEYSNFGVGLLGHVLALRAGVSYEELVKKRICDDLDLDATSIEMDKKHKQRLAPGHSAGTEVPNWDLPTLAGAGALRSSAKDMLSYVAASAGLKKTRLRRAMDLAQTPQRGVAADTRVGLGWHIVTGSNIVTHSGATGGYTCFAGFIPGEKGVVILTNSNRVAEDVGLHLLDPTAHEVNKLPEMQQLDAAVLARHVGFYELAPDVVFDIRASKAHLTAQMTGQQPLPLFAKSETEFFNDDIGGRVVFDVNDAGETTGLTVFQGGVERAAKKIDSYTPPPPRVAVAIDTTLLDAYVGRYELTGELVFDVKRDGDQLTVQLSGQPRFPVFPESPEKFFYKVVEAQITFVTDESGKATSLILHQGGVEQPAQRVE